MSEKINIKKGDETDVMERIIDFGPLDTSSREDDGAWNVMKLYGAVSYTHLRAHET